MFLKIFINEMMGTKFRMIKLLLVMVITFTLLAMSINSIESQIISSDMPDVELSGINNSPILQYEMYTEISPIYELFTLMNTENYFEIYPSVIRACISIQSSTLKQMTIYIEALDENYMNKHLKKDLVEGVFPSNDKEIVIGRYFKEYFDLNVGDFIGKEAFSLHNDMGSILFNLSMDLNNQDYKDYKIVGVVENDDLNFTMIRLYNGTIKANHMLVYFTGNDSEVQYQDLSDMATQNGLNTLIGTVKDNFLIKKNMKLNQNLSIAITIIIFLAILILTVLYVMKGINRKVGILKSLGIQDRIIIKIFANGFAILLSVSLIISIGIIKLIYYFINKDLNEYYGFNIEKFKYSFLSIGSQVAFMIIGYFIIFITIKIRTSRISPRECITKI